MARRRHSRASRAAAVGAGLLALVLAADLPQAGSPVELVLEAVIVLAAGAGAAAMWLHNCFESRLTVGLAAAGTAGGIVLALTVGVPGEPAVAASSFHVLVLGLCAAVGGLLAADSRARRHRRRPPTSATYAL